MRRLLLVLLLLTASSTALSAAAWAAGPPEALSAAAVASYEVRWIERRAEKTFDGELAEGSERGLILDLVQPNLTRVDFVLSWVETGDALSATQEDTFRLAVVAPDGSSPTGSPARGATNVLVVRTGALNEVPEAGSVDEAGLEAVRAHVATEGQGPWRATIALESAGNPAGQRIDRGNTYVLTVVLRWFEASVLKSVSLEPPRTLGPGGLSASAWEWATYGLGGASILLGGFVVLDRKRGAK